jgi:elongation factor G
MVDDVPADLRQAAQVGRQDLIDLVSEFDDTVMEKYVSDQEVTADDLRKALRRGPSTTWWCRCCAGRPSRTRGPAHAGRGG